MAGICANATWRSPAGVDVKQTPRSRPISAQVRHPGAPSWCPKAAALPGYSAPTRSDRPEARWAGKETAAVDPKAFSSSARTRPGWSPALPPSRPRLRRRATGGGGRPPFERGLGRQVNAAPEACRTRYRFVVRWPSALAMPRIISPALYRRQSSSRFKPRAPSSASALRRWLWCEQLGHSIVVGKSVERQS